MNRERLYGQVFLVFALILIIVSCFTGTIQANVYYVSTDNIKASDNNPGTKVLPWKTIQKAATTLIAGDTVFIENGIYRESIEVKNSGTSYRNMISFIADGDNVYIKGSDIANDWNLWKDNIWMKKNWQFNSQQVFVDGNILQQIGGNPLYSPNRLPAVGSDESDITPGSFYYNSNRQVLYIQLRDNSNPNDKMVEASTRRFDLRIKDKQFIRLEGLKFLHSNLTAYSNTGGYAVIINGDNCIANKLEADWCDFEGIGGKGDSLIITNCIANYNGDAGMTFSGTNILMSGNTTNYNNYRNFKIGWHSGGVKNVKMYNSVIEKHTSMGNNGPGIWFDVECKNITISDCKTISNKGNGIFYEISDYATIMNNITTNNGKNGIYIASSNNCGVLNNLVSGNYRGITVAVEPGRPYTLLNNNVKNNIIANNKNAEIVIAPDREVSKDNRSDYNLYFNNNKKINLESGYHNSFRNLDQWQNGTGNDMNSFVDDPKIIEVSADSLFLSPNSPAYGKGVYIAMVKKDFNDNTRKKDRFDIGPYSK